MSYGNVFGLNISNSRGTPGLYRNFLFGNSEKCTSVTNLPTNIADKASPLVRKG